MSQEINAFVNSKNMPNKDTWQKSITNLGFPLTLHPNLDLSKDSGFSPCKLADEESGFEIYVDEAGEMLAYYPHLKDDVTGRDIVISFRWGSDFMELACILCAVAALVNDFGAVAYFPDNDFLYDFSGLLKEANDLVADIAGE